MRPSAGPAGAAAEKYPLLRDRVAFYLREAAKGALNRDGEREAIVRWYVFGLIRRFSPSVAVDKDGMRYHLSTADDVVSRVTFARGSYEADAMAAAIGIVEELTGRAPLQGRTFVDVGANVGTSTVPSIKVFGAARAVAFEPAPEAFKLLQCNIVANDLGSAVRAFQVALSDTSGKSHLELSPTNWGDHRVRAWAPGENALGEDRRDEVEIDLARFDDLAAEAGIDVDEVGLVWIDTQGHEGHVLAGAKSVLASSVPVVIEYWPYGLERSGGLSLLHELVATHYRTVVDVRASMVQGSPASLPAQDVAAIRARCSGRSFTDLVLLS